MYKLADNTRRHRLKTAVQNIGPIIRHRMPDRNDRASFVTDNAMRDRVDRGFGRTVEIGDPRDLEVPRNLAPKLAGEGFAAQRQMIERCAFRSVAKHRFKKGRHATDERHAVALHLLPELNGRFPNRVADNNRRAAAHQRQQRLFDRGIERRRNQKRRAETLVHIEVLPERKHLVGQACVLDDNGLWRSGRARGVDDVGRVARIEVERRRGVGLARDRRCVGIEPNDAARRGNRYPIHQRRLRHQNRHAGVGQHELQTFARITGIDRQIGAAGFEDAEQADQHLRRALDAQPHHGLGPDAQALQMMRQPVGVGVERRVAQRAVLEHHRHGIRRARRLRGEQFGKRQRRGRLRRVVPEPQDGVALGRIQNGKVADRAVGIGDCFQQPQKSLPIGFEIGRRVERRVDIEVDPKRPAVGAVVNGDVQVFDRAQRQIVAPWRDGRRS